MLQRPQMLSKATKHHSCATAEPFNTRPARLQSPGRSWQCRSGLGGHRCGSEEWRIRDLVSVSGMIRQAHAFNSSTFKETGVIASRAYCDSKAAPLQGTCKLLVKTTVFTTICKAEARHSTMTPTNPKPQAPSNLWQVDILRPS